MTRMLVVASPTVDVLCTDSPLPTDGLPEQADCPRHGRVVIVYGNDGHIADDGPDTGSGHAPDCYGECRHCPVPVQLDPRYPCGPLVPDGPFPFTVAVWQEVDCPLCYGGKVRTFECADDHERFLGRCQDCPDSGQVGAVVATVQVTGKSHGCSPSCALHPCGRGDLDGWHTPTGTVTRLDVPIPMGRPERPDYSHGDTSSVPASWWWADLDLEVPA